MRHTCLRIISLNVYVADRCCDICTTQLTRLLLVCARNVPVIPSRAKASS